MYFSYIVGCIPGSQVIEIHAGDVEMSMVDEYGLQSIFEQFSSSYGDDCAKAR